VIENRKYPLNQLYFYLSNDCNLRCRHCWIAPKYRTEGHADHSLDVDLFCSIIGQAERLGLSGVKLTGGEPLLHPNINEILAFIKTKNIRLIVETNGTLCTPELARQMAECKDPFVSVSLDGANAETHEWVRGVRGCFEASLQGIRNLVEAGFKPQIIMTLMRRNKDQVEDMVCLAESRGAGSIKFSIMQPTARGERMHEEGESLTLEEMVGLGKWVETELSSSTSLQLYYDQPLAFRSLGRLFGHNGDSFRTCGILGILGVLSNGSYALCGIGESVPYLVFGHAARDPLEDVWAGTPVLSELRQGLPQRLEGICAKCLMKDLCLGSCIAQNYYTNKNLWAPYWYCEQAYEQGLFPDTRIKPVNHIG